MHHWPPPSSHQTVLWENCTLRESSYLRMTWVLSMMPWEVHSVNWWYWGQWLTTMTTQTLTLAHFKPRLSPFPVIFYLLNFGRATQFNNHRSINLIFALNDIYDWSTTYFHYHTFPFIITCIALSSTTKAEKVLPDRGQLWVVGFSPQLKLSPKRVGPASQWTVEFRGEDTLWWTEESTLQTGDTEVSDQTHLTNERHALCRLMPEINSFGYYEYVMAHVT